jgi:hypothetical protein
VAIGDGSSREVITTKVAQLTGRPSETIDVQDSFDASEHLTPFAIDHGAERPATLGKPLHCAAVTKPYLQLRLTPDSRSDSKRKGRRDCSRRPPVPKLGCHLTSSSCRLSGA